MSACLGFLQVNVSLGPTANVETGKMSIAVACRGSLVLGQSADLYILWYGNQPIVATSKPSLGHRDGGHLAGFYVTDHS